MWNYIQKPRILGDHPATDSIRVGRQTRARKSICDSLIDWLEFPNPRKTWDALQHCEGEREEVAADEGRDTEKRKAKKKNMSTSIKGPKHHRIARRNETYANRLTMPNISMHMPVMGHPNKTCGGKNGGRKYESIGDNPHSRFLTLHASRAHQNHAADKTRCSAKALPKENSSVFQANDEHDARHKENLRSASSAGTRPSKQFCE